MYDELRKLAEAKLRTEDPGQTLQATALVHEAYVRLVDVERAQEWESRGHFFAAAAEAIRRILIDRARHKRTLKRGGDRQRVQLTLDTLSAGTSPEKLIAMNEALEKLEALDPQKSQLVKLRFFAGLSNRETASAIGVSASTADRYWTYARAWLQREMSCEE